MRLFNFFKKKAKLKLIHFENVDHAIRSGISDATFDLKKLLVELNHEEELEYWEKLCKLTVKQLIQEYDKLMTELNSPDVIKQEVE